MEHSRRDRVAPAVTIEKYVNAAQQRVLRTFMVLADHDTAGVPPGEIAKAVSTLASNTTRDLANLKHAGPDFRHPQVGGNSVTSGLFDHTKALDPRLRGDDRA